MANYPRIVELLSKLPSPEGFTGLAGETIAAFSEEIGIELPASLTEWLTLVNGAYVDSQYLIGIRGSGGTDMGEMYALHPEWRAAGYIPVAGDGCGNYYLIATRQEYGQGFPVVFVDHEENLAQPAYIVSSDFQIFVVQFVLKEVSKDQNWPFNERVTRAIDPDILRFSGIPLPWDS